MKVCSEAFVIEGVPCAERGYDGGLLLVCARCKTTYFKDRDSQKKLWKLHKRHCVELTVEQTRKIDRMSLHQATDYLATKLHSANGSDSVYLMKHIRKLFDHDAPDPTQAEMNLHAIARTQIFREPSKIYEIYARLGMAEYLLTDNDEDLFNEKTRHVKKHLATYHGRPEDDFIDTMISDATERKRLKAAGAKYERLERKRYQYGYPPSMKFCYLYYNLIVMAAVQSTPSMSSFHDGKGKLRQGLPLYEVALRRALSLWSDRQAFDSCIDAMAPAASLAITAFDEYSASGKLSGAGLLPGEMLPGLTAPGAVLASLSEFFEDDIIAHSKYSENFLCRLATEPRIWNDISMHDRATVLRAIICLFDMYTKLKRDMPMIPLIRMFDAVSGMEKEGTASGVHRLFPGTRRAIWTSCATDYKLGRHAAGDDCTTQAFFYYLLRNTPVDAAWVDILVLYVDWFETPYYEIPIGANYGLAIEKRKCIKLSMGKDEYS